MKTSCGKDFMLRKSSALTIERARSSFIHKPLRSLWRSSLHCRLRRQFPALKKFDGFSPLQVLAAIIIHETLHTTGDFPPETGQFAVEDSLANSSLVVNACFKKRGS